MGFGGQGSKEGWRALENPGRELRVTDRKGFGRESNLALIARLESNLTIIVPHRLRIESHTHSSIWVENRI